MAEKKIGDLALAITIGVFCLSAFTYIIIAMDNNTNNSEAIGNMLNNQISNSSFLEVSSSLEQLQQKQLNDSSYKIINNQYIDTRGNSEANQISSKNPATITSFAKNVMNMFKFDGSGLILWLIVGLIGTIGLILLLRSFLGSFRI